MNTNQKRANNLYIEISGKCPAKCPYCAQQRLKNNNNFGELMSPDLFRQILEYLSSIKIIDPSILPTINLLNWGEPFVNPEINKFIEILGKHGYSAGLSSNLIIKPNIEIENFSIIDGLIFSLSGFSQETYGKIHGASLQKTLNNFELFYEQKQKYSPRTKISVSWHRYVFNEHELWKAYEYFNRPGINFVPSIAYFNDAQEMVSFIEGTLSEKRLLQSKEDLFINYLSNLIDFHKKKTQNYYCSQWERIVIDERGQMLLCCGVTGYDSTHILGNVLEMSEKEIWESKRSDSFCNRCISSGFARFGNTLQSYWFFEKPLPPGGGIHTLKYWKQRNLNRNKLIQSLLELPYGKQVVPLLLEIRRRLKRRL